MSQAALPTKPALRLPRPSRALVLQVGAALAVAGVLAAIILPQNAGALRQGVHLHAPRLDLLLHTKPLIQLHLTAALIALVDGTVLLAGVKGTGLHKTLGWTWVVAMFTVAASSLFITESHPGRWSFIHFFSGWTLIALPMGIAAIKRRNVRVHRRLMTGLFVGGLLVAGAFTFVPGRLMFAVFFG